MAITHSKSLVVIGGNDAGLSAAGRAKRLDPQWQVTVIERTSHSAYASCGLPLYIAGQVDQTLVAGRSPAELEKERQICIRNRCDALEINAVKRLVVARDLQSGEIFEQPYHKLVLATGSRPRIPAWAQEKADNLFTLRTYADAERLKTYLDQHPVRQAVVVGAGYIGLEIAEALHERGIRTAIVEQASRPFAAWSEALVEPLIQTVQQHDIALHCNCSVTGVRCRDGHIDQVEVKDQPPLPCDLLFIAVGIEPEVSLAQAANIPLGKSGAIHVDRYQQTDRLNTYAVGDCCESIHLLTRKPVWAPFAGVASKQGQAAGSHIGGKADPFPGVLASSLVRVFGLEMGATGLNADQARAAGYDPQTTAISHPDRSEYIPDNRPVTVALISDKKSDKLLGAQISGPPGSGHRLNILAAVLTAGMTARELAYLDLSYIPQLAPVWDPVSIAGRVASKSSMRRI